MSASSVVITSVVDAQRRRLGQYSHSKQTGPVQRKLADRLSITYEVRGIPAADVARAVSQIDELTGVDAANTFVETLRQDFTAAGGDSPSSLGAEFQAATTSVYVLPTASPTPAPNIIVDELQWYDEEWKLYSTIGGGALGLILVLVVLMKLRPKQGKYVHKDEKLSKAAQELRALGGSPVEAPAKGKGAMSHYEEESLVGEVRESFQQAEEMEQPESSEAVVSTTELEQELEQSGVSEAARATVLRAASAPRPVPAADMVLGLPSGWQAIKDGQSGEDYYYNTLTGESTWDKPEMPAAAGNTSPAGDAELLASVAAPLGVVAASAFAADPVSFTQTEDSFRDYTSQMEKEQALLHLQRELMQEDRLRRHDDEGQASPTVHTMVLDI